MTDTNYVWHATHLRLVRESDGSTTRVKPMRAHVATFPDGGMVVLPGPLYDRLDDDGTLDAYVRRLAGERDG